MGERAREMSHVVRLVLILASLPCFSTWHAMGAFDLAVSAAITVRAPMEIVWTAFSNFEQMPKWMPWIHNVEVLQGGVSKWTMRHCVMGIPLAYSWTAKEKPPVKYRLIHWQTTSGLDNQGSVEFWPEGANYSHSQEVGVRMNLIIRLPKPLAYMTRSDEEDGKRIKVMVHKILSSDLVRFKRLMEESASPGTATARISNPQDESYHQAPKASGIHDTQRWRRLETHLRSAVGLAHGGGGGQCCIGLLTVHASVSVRCLVHLPSVKECIFSMSLYLCDLRRFERILRR